MRSHDLVPLALVCSRLLACGDAGGGTASSSSTSGGVTGTTQPDPTEPATSRADTSGSGGGEASSSGETAAATSTAPTTTASAETSSTGSSGAATTGGETDAACGDVFTDPDGDGSLRLSGDEVFVLGPGPYNFSWICVQDSARLLVCDETTIFLGKDRVTVIEGLGIGAIAQAPVKVNLHLEPDPVDVYIYFNATDAPISLLLFATGANLVYSLYGMAGVSIDGQNMQNSATYQAGEPNFPPCP